MDYEIIFEGEHHTFSTLEAPSNIMSEVYLDEEWLNLKVRDCLGHPNPMMRTFFAIYIEEKKGHSAFRFCCVPPLEKVGDVWQ